MYLSPDKGFKYSIAYAPSNPFDVQVLGDINFGKVSYDLNQNVATYFPPMAENPTVLIQLIPGDDDTMESWFKVGGANLIADKLLADGKTQPCLLTTSTAKNAKMKTYTLKASDYKTWAERRKALEKLLLSLK